MTLSWPRLTWPALAMRQVAPWSRKMSATSRAGRGMSAGALGRRLVWLRPQRREPIERAHDHADGVGGDTRIERGGLELGGPEQDLDHADVDVLLQQVGREAVAQRVRRDPLGDPGPGSGSVNRPIELTRGERVDRVLSREQPDLGPGDPPPVPQELEELRREQRKAIPSSLALLDPEQHAPGIDVADLERYDLGHAQARAKGSAQGSLVLRPRRRLQDAHDLFEAQDDGDLARLGDERQRFGHGGPVHRDGEEEPQGRDRAVDGWRADAGLGPVQLVEAQLLGRGRIGRSAEEGREVLDVADIVVL